MEKREFKLFDSEYRFAEIVWEHEPINSTELVKLCLNRLGWKKSTTYTVLKKLCERGIMQNNNTMVSSLAKREDVQRYDSNEIMQKRFNGSLPQFVTAFLDGRKITKEEADELRRIIDAGSK